MFEKILLPLDGSQLAEMALPYGEELARRLGSEVVLFHVCGPEHEQQKHMHKIYLDGLAKAMERNLRKGQPESTTAKVRTQVESGEPRETICDLVAEKGVDLIIMTAVSASGKRIAKMVGSVTDHVCRTVPIPVMLIRPYGVQRTEGKKPLISRILLPLDGSDLSKLALPVGEELAVKLEAEITLFQMAHMIIPYGDEMTGAPSLNYAKLSQDVEEVVRAEVITLEKELKAKGLNVTHIVTSGTDAASGIIEVDKKIGADLVVMSTHGRSGLGRWVFGSVAEKVLRHGEIPLLLVNARAG